jgi:uncharacterized protein YpmB
MHASVKNENLKNANQANYYNGKLRYRYITGNLLKVHPIAMNITKKSEFSQIL